MPSHLKAQDFIYKNFTRENGLPGTEVYKVIQDRKGYIWGISDGGVFKYNGRSFKTFSISEGLPGYSFFGLFEDAHGKIWVTSFNGRVGFIQNDRYHELACNDSLSVFLRYGNRLIYDIHVDAGDTVWLGTMINLIKISPSGNYSKFEIVDFKSEKTGRVIIEPEEGHLISSVNSESGGKFSTSFDTLYRFQVLIQTKNLYKIVKIDRTDLRAASPVSRQVKLHDGSILFSFYNRVYKVHPDGSLSSEVFPYNVIKIIEDSLNNVWICFSRGGAWKFAGGDINTVAEKHLTEMSVASLMTDNEGGLWMCTLENGLYYTPTIRVKIFYNTGKPDAKIIGLCAIGNSVAGITRNQVLFKVENDSFSVLKNYNMPMPGERSLFHRHNKKIFVSGLVTGLLDTCSFSVKPFINFKRRLNLIDMAFGQSDTVYYLTYSDIFTVVSNKIVDTTQLPVRGRNILYAKGKLLLGTLTGMYELNGKVFTDYGNKDKRLQARINYLFMDSKKRVWACTKGEGLLYNENNHWRQINLPLKLQSNIANFIIETSNNTFYVATENGISKLIERNDSIYVSDHFSTGNGVSGNVVYTLQYHNGNLWAGTHSGLVKISPPEYEQNPYSPPVYLTKVELNDTYDVSNKSGNSWSYNQNNFTFSVDVLSYSESSSQSLLYELLRGNDTLRKKNSGNVIALQNLLPGKYELRIWGVGSKEALSRTPAKFTFNIRSPFWITWWFVLIVILLAFILIYVFVKSRINKQQKKQQEQLEIERKLSGYKLQALHAQMNPHFVFNAINSIQSQILQKRQHDAYNHLTKFSQLIRLVLVNTNEQTITVAKELEALKLYVELEKLRFEDSFDFSISIDENIPIENTYMPAMVIQPFVENAIWHGLMPLNGIRSAQLKVTISRQKDKIYVCVEDNGIGREKSNEIKKGVQHKSLGISLTQQRLELISKTGSRIQITDIKNEDNIVTGTKVEIWI